MRLQELRGSYGIKAPAPICTDDQTVADVCQVVQAPAGDGRRLIPDDVDGVAVPPNPLAKPETEIRLTYRELSALIEDAIRNLR